MNEKKIVLPDGMLKAAYDAQLPADNPTFSWDEADEMQQKFYRRVLTAALRWLSENPMVPSDDQIEEILRAKASFIGHFEPADWVRWGAIQWQQESCGSGLSVEALLVEAYCRGVIAGLHEIKMKAGTK